jgi:hypothetical protein
VGAGQIGRQYTPLPDTPMKNLPSNRASRESRAREQIFQSSFIFLSVADHNLFRTRSWTFSDRILNIFFQTILADWLVSVSS